jgi:hypothetical protein
MNNFYLLKYESENLGDDIQTVATMDILDSMNVKYSFVYRDLINGYFFNPLKNNYIIFNGWFTNGYGFEEYYLSGNSKKKINPTWPPKGNFKPIIYSFHISEWGGPGEREVHSKFLDKESVSFYKSFGRAGCRDTHTLNIMNKLGVKSYLSNCITLSLNKEKYKNLNSPQNDILFVDVPEAYCETLSLKVNSLYKESVIKKLTHKISSYDRSAIERFKLARYHLSAFCNAKLVITSRLHVLLPCLAFGTPVIFIVDDSDLNNSRIVDYIKLANTMLYSEIDKSDLSKYLTNKYDSKLSQEISDNFKRIINEII